MFHLSIFHFVAGATAADWWSVGVFLFECITGLPPFNAQHPLVGWIYKLCLLLYNINHHNEKPSLFFKLTVEAVRKAPVFNNHQIFFILEIIITKMDSTLWSHYYWWQIIFDNILNRKIPWPPYSRGYVLRCKRLNWQVGCEYSIAKCYGIMCKILFILKLRFIQ